MKKKLAQIFKDKCVTGVIPDDAHKYYWYLDEENKTIGISKEISSTERALIELVYESVSVNKFTDATKLQWLAFLVGQNSNKIPVSPPLSTHINFIFFSHDLDTNLQLEFESLVQSFDEHFKVFFLESGYGVVLNLSEADARINHEVKDFFLAAKQDFSQELTFYQTVSYEINRRLPEKFSAEFDLFKKFKNSNTDFMRYKDIFLNYMISSDVVQKHPIFTDWFRQIFLIDNDLLAVVKCYLENGFNITTGSKIMHMHRNTFMNKLDRFVDITGLDVKNFDEAAIAYLLIKLRKGV